MRQNWPEVPIRSTYLGLFDGPHATPSPVDDGPVFLGIGNLTEDGHLDLNQTKHISEADFPKWTKRVVPMAGDIVFTYEATLNRYAIIPSGFHGCLGRRLALIRPNPEVVDTRWLHYYFFGREWRSVIAANTLSGATVDRIPLTTFPDFPVRFPPLKTQRRIASILSAYDDLIENNTRRIAILEEMARRIYEEWFVHFRFPGHEQVKMVESELGLIPEGWSVEKVASVVQRLPAGQTYKKEGVAESGSVMVVDQSTSDYLGFHDLVADHPASVNAPHVIFGDHTCKLKLMLRPFSVGPNTIPFLGTGGLDSIYVFQLVRGLVQTREYKRHWTDFSDKQVVLCEKELASRYGDAVRSFFHLAQVLDDKNRTLRATRDLLLPKLISGELDVSTLPEPEEAIAA